MFIGEYKHSLDNKNRVIIPAKFREALGETFFVTIGFEGSLDIYTQEDWDDIIQELSSYSRTSRDARLYVRHRTSKATECTLDGQGRIQLPQVLIDSAKIDKKCVVIGANDHIEIWAEERWTQYDSLSDETFEEIAERLSKETNNGAR